MALGPKPRQGWDIKEEMPLPSQPLSSHWWAGRDWWQASWGHKGPQRGVRGERGGDPGGGEEVTMTHRGSPPKQPSTKQAHFTTSPSTETCLQNWVPWKASLGFQGKQPWRYGFLSCGLSPLPGTWLQECELKLIAPFYTYGTALGWEKIFLKDWKKKILKSNLAFG